MSKVAVLFKVYPKEGVSAEALADAVKRDTSPAGMQIDDVAFGIKVVKAMFKFDDSETSSSKIEEKLRAVKGVGEIEVMEEGLL
ncbi:MAG: hypothetical protein KGI06_02020 [Candidatus Micrarchaeota archaeon]|nr:hypothetical protein [Candidatus Micrarchaeota archaeon]